LKSVCCIGISLITDVKALYNENYETLKEEVKKLEDGKTFLVRDSAE
jgi:hypothetical protein